MASVGVEELGRYDRIYEYAIEQRCAIVSIRDELKAWTTVTSVSCIKNGFIQWENLGTLM